MMHLGAGYEAAMPKGTALFLCLEQVILRQMIGN